MTTKSSCDDLYSYIGETAKKLERKRNEEKTDENRSRTVVSNRKHEDIGVKRLSDVSNKEKNDDQEVSSPSVSSSVKSKDQPREEYGKRCMNATGEEYGKHCMNETDEEYGNSREAKKPAIGCRVGMGTSRSEGHAPCLRRIRRGRTISGPTRQKKICQSIR